MKLVIDKEQMPIEIFSTMGCRTANGADVNFTKEYYKENIKQILKNGKIDNSRLLSAAQKDGRGNICPATIILPTLAMQCKKKFEKRGSEVVVNEFFKLLESKIGECKDSLIERFNYIASQSPDAAFFVHRLGRTRSQGRVVPAGRCRSVEASAWNPSGRARRIPCHPMFP